ncbi:hypothetical protein [Edaphobacter sp.]|uniref:hypothetical protein n=1 Tax=Edaphobacter sp. TaxID=1934404 RepID=UPI002DBE2AFD|nr:hypothetical protein [Edaphobacter sp.]HEU5340271.1 hypothetical protein [Edaphobacter sp.]
MTTARKNKRALAPTPKLPSPVLNPLGFPIPNFPISVYFQETDIASPVVPGQPLTAKFVLYTYFPVDDWGTGYRIKLYFERSSGKEVLIYQNPDPTDPNANAWLPFAHWRPPFEGAPPPASQPDFMIDPAQYLIDVLDNFPPGTGIGDEFYQFGTKQLRCEIETNGPKMLVFSQAASLEVVPCGRQPFWWTWSPTNPVGAEWKQNYTLSGSITDPNPYVPMQISVMPIEVNTDGEKKNYDTLEANVYPSPPSVPQTLTLPSINQDWTWIIDGIWFPETTELSKDFTYTSFISATDSFGNQYDPTVSENTWTVTVTVPQKKLAEGQAAFNLAIGASVVGGLSAILPWLAAVAAALAIAAAVVGKYADDPPSPKPTYIEEVKVSESKIGTIEVIDDLVPLRTLLQTIEDAVLHLLAFSEIESRYLGALAAANQKGMHMQSQAASVMRVKIVNFAGAIHLAAGAALEALKPHNSKIEAALKAQRFGPKQEAALQKLRLTKGARKRLIEIVKTKSFKERAQTPGFLPALILDAATKTADVCKTFVV